MKKLLVGVLALALVMGFSMAYADPLVYVNSRPVTIGSSSDGSAYDLQNLLPMFNVATDQQIYGYWQLGGINPGTLPTVAFEITANSATLEMGIFSDINGDTDAAGRTAIDIFKGPAGAGTSASVTFSGGLMTISGAAGAVNNGTYAGVTPTGFGFYIQPTGDSGPIYYTLDQLNPLGLAQALAFNEAGPNRWTIAFEDTQVEVPGALTNGNGLVPNGDYDYNDFIFQIESIVPVPEPATLILLGAGLLGLAAIRRKK